MSIERPRLARVGLAGAVERGQALFIPQAGTGGGGEYGAAITNAHREFAVTREPVAHRMVFTVAHDVWDNWFKLKLSGTEENAEAEASTQFDKHVQDELRRLRAKEELTRLSVFERGFGWAILAVGYKGSTDHSKPVKKDEAAEIEEIVPYGPLQISKVDTVQDPKNPRYGLPEVYQVRREGSVGNLNVHWTRCIHVATRRFKHFYEGLSVLDPVWDRIVELRNICWGMGQTMFRYGSGFPDITFTNAELEQIEDYISSGAFSNISARSYFVHNENQKLEFKGAAANALNPEQYYLPIMEQISMGSGIPLAILKGAQAGALTGSEVNEREYWGLISDEQSAYEPAVRDLVGKILGVDAEENEFTFDWKSGMELTELEKMDLELKRLQALQIQMQFMTRNEVRAKFDSKLKKLSQEQGGEEIAGVSGGSNKGWTVFENKPNQPQPGQLQPSQGRPGSRGVPPS